ncbi:MAG: hypothetical protein LBI91_05735 [Spirochaetaceae bacterium]|jgi:hypothetical protein|nr:hypothetical protein [Spirochaetaceae bacterium]
MKDTVTLAYINMYGILGALEDLCRFSPEAKELVSPQALPGGKPLSIGFTVKNGPAMILRFEGGACTARIGEGPCDIKLGFGSFEKFNGLIDGTATPIPSKGFTKLKFLTRNFVRLTAILETYLRAGAEALADRAFFEASTTIMFFLISRTAAQIANYDKIGSFTASNIPDGTVLLSIAGGPQAALCIADHCFSFSRAIPESYHAVMEFSSMELARQLFDGKVSALGCVGQGLITMRGNLGMLDNINRILDRVAVYLA